MFEGLRRLTFQIGEQIFEQDQVGHCAYLIEAGSVEISTQWGEEPPRRIAILGKDELFGEMALIDNKPRSATVTALEETRVVEISKTLVESKLAKEDPIIQHLLLLVLKRFRNTQYQTTWKNRLSQLQASTTVDDVFSVTQKHLVKHIRLASDINEALENEDFQVYYQPILSTDPAEVKGFEALIRWRHPEQGWIPPLEFLGIAEETGQIIAVGEWILDRVCRDYPLLSRAFPNSSSLPPLFVNVNISARQLRKAEDVIELTRTVREHGIDPACMKMEVTETVLIEQPKQAQELLAALRKLGFRIVLDDFGTGYSSLSYLQKFAFDTLKIDQSFIKSMLTETSSMQIIKASIGLAKGLELDVVAEGVENAAQLDALREMGCTYVQGFHFSKPLTLQEAIAFMPPANLQSELN